MRSAVVEIPDDVLRGQDERDGLDREHRAGIQAAAMPDQRAQHPERQPEPGDRDRIAERQADPGRYQRERRERQGGGRGIRVVQTPGVQVLAGEKPAPHLPRDVVIPAVRLPAVNDHDSLDDHDRQAHRDEGAPRPWSHEPSPRYGRVVCHVIGHGMT